MRIVKPSVEIEPLNGKILVENLESYGRICYKSGYRIKEGSAEKFIGGALKRGHFSVIEHEKVTAKIICDRGVTHELVRHRIGSYSQESTRYVNYQDGITVVKPVFWDKNHINYGRWEQAMEAAESLYILLIKNGAKPEEARSVLPNSLKTEIIVTFNMREWRHFFYLRCSPGAHIQIREIGIMLLKKMREVIPVLFDDFNIDDEKLIATTDIIPAS